MYNEKYRQISKNTKMMEYKHQIRKELPKIYSQAGLYYGIDEVGSRIWQMLGAVNGEFAGWFLTETPW